MTNLALSCHCGSVRGTLHDAERGRQMVCYCDDCQTFAHHIGAGGTLDDNGGSHVVQSTPSRVTIESGAEHLGCVRLSPKGALRWYATCCKTPMANLAPGAGLPFIGLSKAFVADDTVDAVVGPVQARVCGEWARGDAPSGTHAGMPKLLMARAAVGLLGDALLGRAKPSPIRHADGSLIAEPTVLTREERAAARAQALGD